MGGGRVELVGRERTVRCIVPWANSLVAGGFWQGAHRRKQAGVSVSFHLSLFMSVVLSLFLFCHSFCDDLSRPVQRLSRLSGTARKGGIRSTRRECDRLMSRRPCAALGSLDPPAAGSCVGGGALVARMLN